MIAARRNNAFRAEFQSRDLDNPFAEGAFRHVAKGKYTHGERAGEDCVCKWFKTGLVYEESYYQADIKTANKCIEIITQFNREKCIDRQIQVNLPEVWEFNENCGPNLRGTKVLQEPYIENYQKFNSNTGWSDDGFAWGRAMQALSHYSYHISGGTLLLCDLQGGIYHDGAILTDPVIMSLHAGQYGPTDLGAKGIESFFAQCKVNEYCQRHWLLPKNPQQVYQARRGTTMSSISTRSSRPVMSMAGYYR